MNKSLSWQIHAELLGDLYSRFNSAIEHLEQKLEKRFDLIYFQGNANRFGHLWQEPSLASTLYDIDPVRTLIILSEPPFSNFCVEVHKIIGFEYSKIESLECASDILKLTRASGVSEIKIFNRTVAFELFGYFYNSNVGISRGHKVFFQNAFSSFKVDVFSRLKIPDHKKIAILHVRESGWTGSGYHDYRNASVSNYIKAVKLLEAHGFFIVRIGDTSMASLEYSSGNILDLAKSPFFQDGDDVVVTAFCDLYVGQNGGPILLPFLFGKDLVLTNEPNPFVGRFVIENNSDSLTITLLKRQKQRGSFLSVAEILCRPSRYFADQFKIAGIELVQNSPEEIESSVDELLKRRAGMWDISSDLKVYKQLEVVWILRQLSGMKGSNLGRPTPNCFISHVHLGENGIYGANADERTATIVSDINDFSSYWRSLIFASGSLSSRFFNSLRTRGGLGTLLKIYEKLYRPFISNAPKERL
jgi:putative glycosyltransferase (TIGR04372 family)